MLAPGLYARRLVVSRLAVPGDSSCRRSSLIYPTCCRCSRGESIATPVRGRVSWSWRPTLPVRWSDHPACTHSLLASAARLVNDHTSDDRRPCLAELIPSVIGLTGDDLHIDALIALRC